MRQLLVESAAAGTRRGRLIGLALAWWGVGGAASRLAVGCDRQLRARGRSARPRRAAVLARPSALATVVLFGVAPALRGARATDLQEAVKDGARAGRWQRVRAGASHERVRGGSGRAIGMVLLVGAGLLLRSFRQPARRSILGFAPGDACWSAACRFRSLGRPTPSRPRSPRASSTPSWRARVRGLPGVRRRSGLASFGALQQSASTASKSSVIEGREPAPGPAGARGARSGSVTPRLLRRRGHARCVRGRDVRR